MTQPQNTPSTVGQIDKEEALKQLSPYSYYPTEGNWDEESYDGRSDISMISSAEQLIRAEMVMGANSRMDRELVDKVTTYLKQYEDEHLWNTERETHSRAESGARATGNAQNPKHVQTDISSDSADPQLRDDLKTVREAEADARDNRRHWYDRMASDLLSKQPSLGRNESAEKYFQPRIIHDGSPVDAVAQLTDTDSGELEQINRESVACIQITDCDGRSLRKHGFTLPLPAVICRSWDSGNVYPFVPWCGVATCTCRTDGDPYATLCKHEIGALQQSQTGWPPGTFGMPSRFTRLFAPQAYSRWKTMNNGD